MLSSYEAIENYLDDNYERECFRETTVGEFVRRHPNGTYLVTMSGVHGGLTYRKKYCIFKSSINTMNKKRERK